MWESDLSKRRKLDQSRSSFFSLCKREILLVFNICLDTACIPHCCIYNIQIQMGEIHHHKSLHACTRDKYLWVFWGFVHLFLVSIRGSSSLEILRSTNLTWRDTHWHTWQQCGTDSRPTEEVYFYHRQRRQITLVCRELYKCKLYWRAISPEKGLYVNAL